ncbi:hypothetical protein [Tardiphaga sp.]|uniref:hypothetical protein n=1 Tax=Tardiphaga sp. TaxID=1926292 RepID=UPI002627B717|nr:hypothetical protein [Tardiphaga sp.]MDB5620419.1 hypothetical protein [Tardiphaga sp.]
MTRGSEKQMGFRSLRLQLADEILQASDQEILSQYAEDVGSPDANAERMRAMFEKTVLLANKGRLAAARAGATASRAATALPVIPIEKAREKLRLALADHASDTSFTLAARKETELSDADVLDMLQAMHELGILK